MTKKRGRPQLPDEEKKSCVVKVYVTPRDREAIQAEMRRLGMTVSQHFHEWLENRKAEEAKAK